MTTPDTKAIRALLDSYTEAQHAMQDGCSDGYCVVRKPRGMHTNGGCRCLYRPDHLTTQRAGNIMRIAQEMESTILALCDALDAVQAENDRLGRDLNMAKYGKPDFAWSTHLEAMADLRAENERLQTIIGNLHTVEGKHRETANAHFHRANRLQAENERLRNFIVDFSETKFDRIDRRSPDPQDDLDPLTDYMAIEAWQEDARAALAQKGGE